VLAHKHKVSREEIGAEREKERKKRKERKKERKKRDLQTKYRCL